MATLHRANVWSAATPVDPIKYYEVGGANLDPAVATDDYYHMCGLYWFRPYDLRKWGSHGAAMETARGGRYVWACGADHPTSLTWAHRDSAEWMIGFTNDPGVFPATMQPIIPWNNDNTGMIAATPANTQQMYEQCWLTYNPEDADGLVFYLNGESSGGGIQHANSLWRSNDLLTWTPKIVSHIVALENGQWSSFQVIRRISAGVWQSHGVGSLSGFAATPGAGSDYHGTYKWTSTNGLTYTMGSTSLKRYRKTDGTLYNYPEIFGIPHVYDTSISDIYYGVGDEFSIGGQRYWLCKEFVGVWQGDTARPQYLSLVPVDADGGILASPAPNRIVTYPLRRFPGPEMIQEAPYHVEDGLLHIYVAHGFSGQADTLSNGFPYCAKWDSKPSDGVLVSFSGTTRVIPVRPYTVAVSAYWGTPEIFHDNGAGVFVGSRIVSGTINYATGAWSVTFNAAPNAGPGVSIRYVENNNTFTANTGASQDGGGLCEQFIDYYTHPFDATAAASHAPVGVTASCAAGVVTLSWYDALPHQSYRVARGTDATTQGTAIGDVTGLTTTNAPGTGLFYYRVTTLNAGTPAGYRIVPVYASTATALVNKHILRVSQDGGDITKINVARMEAAISFLNARDWMRDLLFWASPDFGIKESAGHIVKVYCLGTTRLPRGGDLTFSTSTTTYSATGLNGNCATFINAANNSFGYFGNGRFNPIRKKRQITVATMYERTQTAADITFAGLKTSNGSVDNNYVGTEQPGLSFSHLAGTPGTIQFMLKDDNFGTGARQNTATVAATSTTYNIAIGSYDGTDMKAYHNGTGGTAVSSYDPNPFHMRDTVLAGAKGGSAAWPVLGVGSKNCSYTAPTNPPSRTLGTYVFPANEAQFKASDVFVMARGVNASEATQLTNLFNGFATGTAAPTSFVAPLRLRAAIAAPVTRTLIADFGAAGDGVDDDGPEINAMGAAAAADPTHNQLLVLDSGHTFKITTGQFWTQGIKTATVSGYGATVFRPAASGFEFGGGYVAALGLSQHAPINSVARGATSCTLVTAGDASKLTVGQYVCVGGFNTQGGGDPPNLHFFEYVKIASITGTTTITVTFDRPLRQSYLSTWQDKGAARLLVTNSASGIGSRWDSTIRHMGYNVTGESDGGHSKAFDVRLQDMTVTCFTPTQCSIAYLKNVTVTSHLIEVDKLCDVFMARDCTVTWIQVQSSSVGLMKLVNVTTTDGTHGVLGTPRHAILDGCTLLEFVPGCYHGNAKSLVMTNCAVPTLRFGPRDFERSIPLGAASFDKTGDAGTLNMQSVYSMSGGVITIPRSVWATQVYPPCYVPGCVGFFGYGIRQFGPSFKVTAVTYDATNIYVATSLPGTWPTVPSGVNAVYMHPMPKLTMSGCTGAATAVDLSSAPAGAPVGTYTSRSYNKSHTVGGPHDFPFVVGRVVEIRINVTVAHTGALQVRMFDVPLLNSSGAEIRYEPVIDCAQMGERVITLSGVTGALGSDLVGAGTATLTLPAGAWFVGAAYAGFNSFTNISGTASPFACTITIRTNQEVTADDDPDYAELVAMAEALN